MTFKCYVKPIESLGKVSSVDVVLRGPKEIPVKRNRKVFFWVTPEDLDRFLEEFAGVAVTWKGCIREFTAFTTIAGLASTAAKIPDFSILGAHARFPSRSTTKTVLIVKLTETFPTGYTLDPSGGGVAEISHMHATPRLKHRFPPVGWAGGNPTEETLERHYLGNKATLVPLLVGAISATALVYVRAPAPPAQSEGACEGGSLIGAAVTGFPGIHDGGPPPVFSLMLANILDGKATDRGVVPVDLAVLATGILAKTPNMEWARAAKRAHKTLADARAASRAVSSAAAPATTLVFLAPAHGGTGNERPLLLGRGAKEALRQEEPVETDAAVPGWQGTQAWWKKKGTEISREGEAEQAEEAGEAGDTGQAGEAEEKVPVPEHNDSDGEFTDTPLVRRPKPNSKGKGKGTRR
ncbi:hypothetical protein DFH27DRAFT_616760 [Peziza echinospora]|nr:hypothetical protein DFH27DRAFT_616760 [Peziza echinospora]